MTQKRILHRRATLLLLAAVALPSAPLLAQDQPVQEPPVTEAPPVDVPQPVIDPVAPETPVTATPPPATTPLPKVTTPTPAAETEAAPPRRAATRTARTTARAAPAPRAAAPARSAAPATSNAAPAPAPAPEAAPAPAAQAPAAAPIALPVPEQPAESGPSIWTWLIGGALLALLAFALLNMLRHRRRGHAPDEVHDEAPLADEPPIYTEPAPLAAVPAAAVAAQPVHRREVLSSPIGDVVEPEEFAPAAEAVAVGEDLSVGKADADDAAALAAASVAPDGRPWLEFLMRPVRAGTTKDGTVVELELTVGNTGDVPARDVRISTFMFAAGSAAETEMERMLIDEGDTAEVEIAAGDAKRVEASMALPRDALSEEKVLPVVVADARYRLPDGSEGRTRAAFEVGIPSGDGLDPFPTDRSSGLIEGVEARLHGEPERV